MLKSTRTLFLACCSAFFVSASTTANALTLDIELVNSVIYAKPGETVDLDILVTVSGSSIESYDPSLPSTDYATGASAITIVYDWGNSHDLNCYSQPYCVNLGNPIFLRTFEAFPGNTPLAIGESKVLTYHTFVFHEDTSLLPLDHVFLGLGIDLEYNGEYAPTRYTGPAGWRIFLDSQDVSEVPLPASAWLLVSALFGLLTLKRKNK